ncbi:magnesium Mg(2+) and cobalt Co(2+) transport protein CorA [Planoprotostelium fungivorum]|uniref:Magnesium Mg(2+) and cobalt Co(2+) transport protein CorA n=1 Tax=Planoprotostelium fungivorum TaxID=1890364 RepID=A0A2P6N2P0_9EUKA|nr:magnesium Mg(2+) and cobalt Co(2+) transport protein CorA [Planoprotostelium fungivorum]
MSDPIEVDEKLWAPCLLMCRTWRGGVFEISSTLGFCLSSRARSWNKVSLFTEKWNKEHSCSSQRTAESRSSFLASKLRRDATSTKRKMMTHEEDNSKNHNNLHGSDQYVKPLTHLNRNYSYSEYDAAPAGLSICVESTERTPLLGKKFVTRKRNSAVDPPVTSLRSSRAATTEGHSTIEEINYSGERIETEKYHRLSEVPEEHPSWARVRWVNIEGLNTNDIRALAQRYQLHPLTVEDITEVPHRPKMELYSNYLFFVFQIPSVIDGLLDREQVSIIISGRTVVTIQEGKKGDCWNPVRASLNRPSTLRNSDSEFFLYSLIDAIVDMLLETLSAFGDRLEQAEMDLFANPRDFTTISLVRGINRELMFIRGISYPTQNVIQKMLKPLTRGWAFLDEKTLRDEMKEYEFYFSSAIRTYIKDIDDNLVRIRDMVELYKEICDNLDNIHQSANDHMMNQIMFILTIVSTIFLPLTFLAGVYGMNFKFFPELNWEHAYLYWWLLAGGMVVITVGTIRVVWMCLGPPRAERVRLKVRSKVKSLSVFSIHSLQNQ